MKTSKKEKLIKKYLGINTPEWIIENCMALLDEFESKIDKSETVASDNSSSHYRALPIQSVSGSEFGVAISDGYVTWEFPINIKDSGNTSIDKIHTKICAVLDCEKDKGQILHYR